MSLLYQKIPDSVHKKAAIALDNNCFFILKSPGGYSPGLIAPTGQTEAQEPQSIQFSSIVYWASPSEMAPTGQTEAQAPHLIHSLLIENMVSPPLADSCISFIIRKETDQGCDVNHTSRSRLPVRFYRKKVTVISI
jgi:hypothetical protein